MIARRQPGWRHPFGMVSRFRQKLSDPRRPPAPFVVGVNRSGTTLLRMMLDAHPELTIPPETHFIPEVIRRANHENTRRRLIRSITKHPRWGDFGLDEEEFRARAKQVRPLTAANAIRCFYEPLRRGSGQAALGRQDAALHARDAADLPGASRGPVRPPDPRRARRRALAAGAGHRRCPGADGGDGRALAATDHRRPRGRGRDQGQGLRGGPLRGSRR